MTGGVPAPRLDAASGPTPAALHLTGVTKTYTATPVLLDAELRLEYGEVHALLGGNGSGKSTLIKVLAGVVPADPGGTVAVGGHATPLHGWSAGEARRRHLRFIHQDLGLVPDLTVAENLFLESGMRARRGLISWRRLRRDAVEILDRFELDLRPDGALAELTQAEQTRLAAARALHDVADDERAVVVLDEPTAALPSHQAEELMQAIRGYADRGHALLVVTHRLGEVVSVCDRTTVLRQGSVVHRGPIGRGQTEEDLGRLITGVDAVTESRGDHVREVVPAATHDGLRLTGLTTETLPAVDLEVRPGEVVGLVDAGGRAASEVLRAVFGLTPVTAGTVELDGTAIRTGSPTRAMARGIAYLPGQRLTEALFPGLTVGANILLGSLAAHLRRGFLSTASERRAIDRAVADFHVWPADPDVEVTSLSGGNQQKVSVTRWMVRDPRCLLLEEPTQGVDIGARAEIWNLVGAAVGRGAAALVVSSDFQELATHCHRVLVYARGRLVSTLAGDALTVPAIAEVVHHA